MKKWRLISGSDDDDSESSDKSDAKLSKVEVNGRWYRNLDIEEDVSDDVEDEEGASPDSRRRWRWRLLG